MWKFSCFILALSYRQSLGYVRNNGIYRGISSTIYNTAKNSISNSNSNSNCNSNLIIEKKNIKSVEEMEEIGAKLSSLITIGDTIYLRGDLGAGKTTFSRGFIRCKTGDNDMVVTSPSYLLDNTYPYGKDFEYFIHHMDLYRLPSNFDPTLLGIPQIFDTCTCLIEWPQRLTAKVIPTNLMEIEILIETSKNENKNTSMNEIIVDKDDYDDDYYDDYDECRCIKITLSESLQERLGEEVSNILHEQ